MLAVGYAEVNKSDKLIRNVTLNHDVIKVVVLGVVLPIDTLTHKSPQ